MIKIVITVVKPVCSAINGLLLSGEIVIRVIGIGYIGNPKKIIKKAQALVICKQEVK